MKIALIIAPVYFCTHFTLQLPARNNPAYQRTILIIVSSPRACQKDIFLPFFALEARLTPYNGGKSFCARHAPSIYLLFPI
jgi:hypothetical protein